MTAKPTSIRGLTFAAGERTESTRARAGESEAVVEECYREYFGSVVRYLMLTGTSPADADEIAQESFLRLFQSLTAGARIERLKQWLVSVAHNLRHDRMEKAVRTAAADSHFVIHQGQSQEEAVIEEQRMERVRCAMQQLTSRQRTYLHLRAEGLLLKEIAQLHGVTVQSVAETCARAVETLGRLTHD